MRYGTNVDKIKIMDFFIHSTYDNITNLIPRVLSLPQESTLVTAGQVSMHANPSHTEGGFST